MMSMQYVLFCSCDVLITPCNIVGCRVAEFKLAEIFHKKILFSLYNAQRYNETLQLRGNHEQGNDDDDTKIIT